MESSYLPLIVGLPLFGAAVVAAFRNRWPRHVLSAVASLIVAAAFIVTLGALFQLRSLDSGVLSAHLMTWGPFGDFELNLGLLGDSVSIWFALVVTGVGFLIHVFSIGYMREEQCYGRYFAKLNYFIFAMSLLVLSDNFVGLLVGWANVGLASFLLIGFWNEKPEAAAAAKKSFIINAWGEVGMISALMIIMAKFGSFAYADVFAKAAEVAHAPLARFLWIRIDVATGVTLLLLLGAIAKSAQLPLHTWLPDAMQGPTPVSALIHAATMVTAGVYLVARAYPLFASSQAASMTVAVIGALGALFGAIVAAGQFDIKKILAFSTLSQVGYMFLGAGVGAYEASLFHFLTHAFFKAQLFLTAGIVIFALHGEQDIRKMGGLRNKMPFAFWSYLVGGLALAGIPPFAGFFSKDEILGEVLANGHPVLWLIGTVAAGVTAFYVVRMIAIVFFGSAPKADKKQPAPLVPGGVMVYPVAILLLLAVVSGWIGIPNVVHMHKDFLGGYFQQYAVAGSSGQLAEHVVNWGAVLVALVLAVIGAFLAWSMYGPNGKKRAAVIAGKVSRFGDWQLGGFGFDTFYRRTIIPGAMGLSRFVGEIADDRFVDGMLVHGLANIAKGFSLKVATAQSGHVRMYAVALFTGVALFLAYYFVI